MSPLTGGGRNSDLGHMPGTRSMVRFGSVSLVAGHAGIPLASLVAWMLLYQSNLDSFTVGFGRNLVAVACTGLRSTWKVKKQTWCILAIHVLSPLVL
jgi:hypothetical protein